jgi:hypothetical protein
VIWWNPGDGSGINYIVQAVPCPSGVADVFAINASGMVSAIKSDENHRMDRKWSYTARSVTVSGNEMTLWLNSLSCCNFFRHLRRRSLQMFGEVTTPN